MGLQGGQGYANLGNQAAQGFGNLGQQYQGMASLLPQLQQQDIQSMMGIGGLNRGRNQSLMDLNYQNFVGQYNLPMQSIQNVGSVYGALGPLAGGYGYAGATPVPFTNPQYAPAGNFDPVNTPTDPSDPSFVNNPQTGGPQTGGGYTGGGGGSNYYTNNPTTDPYTSYA